MIEKKAAFLAGISRRCKQANMDADDAEQVAHLLLMPPKQAAFVLGQVKWDQRELLTKDAGTALMKMAGNTVSFDSNKPSWESTMQNPLTTPGNDATDTAAAGGADDTEKTDASGNAETAVPGGEGGSQDYVLQNSGMGGVTGGDPASSSTADTMGGQLDTDVLSIGDTGSPATSQPPDTDKSTPPSTGNLQRAGIIKGFEETSTPAQMAAGATPTYLTDMQEQGTRNRYNRTIMRGLQKSMGVSFRPVKGGMRSTDINLDQINDPKQGPAWRLMRDQLAAREATERVAKNQRAGWSTAGSGFSGGGVRAARGRGAPAQQLASTGQAPSTGAAVMSAQPGGAALPARDATANFNMSEGTGASAAGRMSVVGGPKAWSASGNTEAYGGDPSRSLSVDYKPPTAQTPTPPPPAAAPAPVLGPTSGDSARGMQSSVNNQTAAGSGMAPPPPAALSSTTIPPPPAPAGDTLEQPAKPPALAPMPIGNEPIGMGATGFKKRIGQ